MSVFNYTQLDKMVCDPYEFEESDDEMNSANSVQSVTSSLNCALNDLISSNSSVSLDPSTASTQSVTSSLNCASNSSVASHSSNHTVANSAFKNDKNTELAFEFMVGRKSNSNLLSTLCDHHLYSRHGSCVQGQRSRPCRAFVIFDPKENKCFRLSKSPPHKHRIDDVESEYWDLVALNEMRATCKNLATLAGGRKMACPQSIFSSVKPK